MAKQYERPLLEIEVKERLESARDELGLSSLSATITYLLDNLTANKKKAKQR